MAIELGSAYVSILPDMSKFKRQMERSIGNDASTVGKKAGDDFSDGMESGAKKGSKRVGTVMKGALKGLGVASLAVGAGAALAAPFVNAASDAQQSIGATEAIYGKYADAVVKNSEKAAGAVGLSANEYRESSNILGALFKNQGVSMDELSGKTDQMVTLGADLAATYGGPVSDSVGALTAAYKGEFDSLDKYGISLKASDISARLAAEGKDKLTGASLKQAQQEATTALIMEQTADAQGMAAKESDTYAGQMARLGASFENVKSTLGTALLPMVTGFVETINKHVIPAVTGFIAGMKDGTGWGGKLADVFGIVKTAATTAFTWIKDNVIPTVQNLIAEFKSGTGAGGGLRDIFEKVRAGFVATFTWLKNEGLPALKAFIDFIIQRVWPDVKAMIIDRVLPAMKAIGTVIKEMWEKVASPALSALWKFIKNTLAPFLVDFYENGIKPTFDLIGKAISGTWNKVIKPVLSTFADVVSALPKKFRDAKNGIANAFSSITNAIARPLNGVIDKVNSFLTNLKNGLNKIPGVNLDGNWTIRKIILDTADATVGSRGGATMLASGGKVPGWSPNDKADNIPAWLTAGEYVLPVGATKRLRSMIGDGGLESLRNGSLPGYADGGEVGIIGRLLGGLKKPFGDSWPGQVAKGVVGTLSPKKIWDKLLSMMGNVFGGNSSVNYGGAYGWAPTGMNWSSIWSRIKAVAPESIMTSNYRPGAITASGVPSLHGQGRAVDIVSGNMPETFRRIRGLLPWSQLFHTPMGNSQIGYRDATIARTHWDHIHAAFNQGGLVPSLYDRGGLLQPGVSLVSNQTNKPEVVLTQDQLAGMGGQGNTIVINGVKMDNTGEVADELLFALKRTRRGKYNRVR